MNGEDQISPEVLKDYKHRTVVSVENLKWDNPEHTSITGEVVFEELAPLGKIPFTTTIDSDTDHGREIWEKANWGEYGEIEEYVHPTAEEIRQAMPALTKRQLKLGLLQNGIDPGQVTALINSMPAQQRAVAKIEWEDASQFKRAHPLVVQIGTALGLTPEQMDAMWIQAHGL